MEATLTTLKKLDLTAAQEKQVAPLKKAYLADVKKAKAVA